MSSSEAVEGYALAPVTDRVHRALEARVGTRQADLDRIVTSAQRLIPSCAVAELATYEGRTLRVLARSADVPPPRRRTVLSSETRSQDSGHHLAPHLSLASLEPPVWVTLDVGAHPPVALIVHAGEPVWDSERGAAAIDMVRRLSTTRIAHLAAVDELTAVRAAMQANRGLTTAVDVIRAELFLDSRDAFAVLRHLAAKHRVTLREAARRVVDAGSTAALRGNLRSGEPLSMRRGLAYIEAHLDDDLTIDDIAAAAGVTPRALQASFRAYRNTTPMAHVRDLRLEQAHQALLSADPSTGVNVAEIAKTHGFHNPGRFAGAYRRRFGRSPRQTLQVWSPTASDWP